MKSWTIAKRITFVVSLLCLLLVASGAIVWRSLTSISQEANFIAADSTPGTILSARMTTYNLHNFINVLTYVRSAPEKRAAVKEEMAKISRNANESLKAYEATITDDEDRKLFEAVNQRRTAYTTRRGEFFKLFDAGKTDEANAILENELPDLLDAYIAATNQLFDLNSKNALANATTIATASSFTTRLVLTVNALALLLGGVTAFFVVRHVNRSLTAIANQLGAGSRETAAAAGEVSTSSQNLASGASEQAASLEETSASLEEISSMTRRNAESATRAKELAGDTRGAAEHGSASMDEMNHAMGAINDSATKIAKIVKTIDEIAFQTNILALNAAVEAARAGEAGAGFAVVADEVRSLARRSATAAKETASLIDEAVGRSSRGVEISQQVSSSFTQIVDKARQVDALIGEIANASKEQTQGIGQVTTAIAAMDKVTQTNAASAEEAAAASEELNAQSQLLREMVDQLETLVRGAQFVAAGAPHETASAMAQPTLPNKSPRLAAPVKTTTRKAPVLPEANVTAEPREAEFFS